MQTQFPLWLAQADRDGRGGLAAEPPAISRGRTCVFNLNLSASTEYGDWTGGAFAAVLRAAPDAGGTALAEYTPSIGTPAGGVTPVSFTLDAGDQGSLPAGGVDTGLAELFMEITFTPTGGAEFPVVSTRQLVAGAI